MGKINVSMESELRLSLLGRLEISRDGKPVERFAQQKSLALLSYLAVTGQPHTRAALAGLLWGQATEANALAALRKVLADLRKQVAPYLIITRQQVAFNRDQPYWLDVETFERQIGEIDATQGAEVMPTGMLMPADITKLAAAVGLHQGDFLAGFHVRHAPAFEEWVLLQRERLRLTALRALHILASHYMAQGAYPQVIEYAGRILTLEPCQEEAHRQMMSALALSGQREAALRQYQACCLALAEEMGSAPQEETTTLFQRIRDGGSPASRAPAFAQNLPCPITPLIGRERERDEIIARLRSSGCRLLTLIGPGGSGKTRLAQEIAATLSTRTDAQPEEVYLVPLASLQSAESLVPAIAHGIGLLFSNEGDPRQELLNYLRQKRLLLILDNFEHLISPPALRASPPRRGGDRGGEAKASPPRSAGGMKGGASLVSDILATAPDVKILVTSRARLNLQAEQLYPLAGMDVPPLPSPSTTNALHSRSGQAPPLHGREAKIPPPRRAGGTEGGHSAAELFLWGARRVNPDIEPTPDEYSAISQICRLVEGMPLAILLAASWARMLTPAEIAAQLEGTITDADGPLNFLETDWGDVPARQRSMRAVFDHSWNLLAERERKILAALSVFRGGFTAEAARQVTGASLHDLATLVDGSLLHRMQGRYGMHELLQQYATDKLRRGDKLRRAEEAETIRDRHSVYYADRLQAWAADLKSARQIAAVKEMEIEIANARAAWDWMVHQGNLAQIDRAMEGLCLFYEWRVRHAEGESACQAAIQHISSIPSGQDWRKEKAARILAKALTWQSVFAYPEYASQLLQECWTLLDDLELTGEEDTRAERAFALYRMAPGLLETDHEQAQQLYEQSIELYQSLEDRWGLANALNGLGTAVWDQAAYGEAQQLHEKSLAIYRELGDQRGVAYSLGRLGTLALLQGQVTGEQLVRESITIYQEIGNRASLVHGFYVAGMALMTLGAFDEAHALLGESVTAFKNVDGRSDIADVMQSCAKIHLGQYEQGRAQAEGGLNVAQATDNSLNAGFALIVLGWEALTRKAHAEAQTLFQESADICQSVGHQDMSGWALAFLGYADRELGQVAQAREHLCQAAQIALEIQSFVGLLFTLPGIALLLADMDQKERAVELYALASRHPAVANSRWFADVVGQPIAAVTAKLPPDVVAAAEERGRARDLEATTAELLTELAEGITLSAPQAPGGSRRGAAG